MPCRVPEVVDTILKEFGELSGSLLLALDESEAGPLADSGAEEHPSITGDHTRADLPGQRENAPPVFGQRFAQSLSVFLPSLGGVGRTSTFVERCVLAEKLLDFIAGFRENLGGAGRLGRRRR